MSILSDELNFLIYRYLQESGFNHSAFTFYVESNLTSCNFGNHVIPPGALVTAVQKGLQYVQAEIGINEDGSSFDDSKPLSLIHAVSPELIATCMSKKHFYPQHEQSQPQQPQQQQQQLQQQQQVASVYPHQQHQPLKPESATAATVTPQETPPCAMDGLAGTSEVNNDLALVATKEPVAKEEVLNGPHSGHHVDSMEVDSGHGVGAAAPSLLGTVGGPLSDTSLNNRIVALKGHEGDVFVCAWNPTCDILASGSGDATARLWDCSNLGQPGSPVTLNHADKGHTLQNSDVTSMEWNHDGSLLATGFYDGKTRIWARNGALIRCLAQHQGPVMAVKWNRKGSFIASGGVDKMVIVWEAQTGEVKQQFQFHDAPALDLDWQSNTCLASCSTDKIIYVCKLGQDKPVKTFKGHENEVNTVKWDPSGGYLASCSDDTTAKIWSLKEDFCVHNLQGHSREIHTIRWSPSGPGSNNPHAPLLLASASFDSTVRLWDAERGACLYVLASHQDVVYGLAFSPNGLYLASGSSDTCVRLWSTQDGKNVFNYPGNSAIFEVCWNRDGAKLAACGADNTLSVLDVSKVL
eukprot:m.14902 g.14902  ORF g.14902 m.14902 type:complete len:579 (+) comp26037_c0_seq2:231-1967(+)